MNQSVRLSTYLLGPYTNRK